MFIGPDNHEIADCGLRIADRSASRRTERARAFTLLEITLAVSEASVLLAHGERERELASSPWVRQLPRGLIFHEAENERGPSYLDLIATAPAKSRFL